MSSRPFRLTPPKVHEHPRQKAICDVLRIEIAPAGKLSRAGVLWYSIDHANYAGEVPGLRLDRGIVAGILDMFLLYQGRGHFVEIKTEEGRLSEAQQSVTSALLMSGGRVGAARDVGEMLRLLDCWEIPRARRVKL
jgi:hypothetical protein